VTRVYVDMVADLFHPGHVEILRRARELGDYLLVGVHSDEAVESYKRRPVMTMEERIRVVEACRYVDEVLPNAPLIADDPWIDEHRIDIHVHGDDLDAERTSYWYGPSEKRGILRVFPYTRGVSTSEVIERIRRREADSGEGG
jgi:cytidyltransferase-like protein